VFSGPYRRRGRWCCLDLQPLTAEDGHAVLLGDGNRELPPVSQVGRNRMAPAHVSPLIAERVELKEEMVLAVEQDGPLGSLIQLGGA